MWTNCKRICKQAHDLIVKLLAFFRLTDRHGLLSLTNITMLVIIYKLAMTTNLNFTDITALALGVLSYQGKRVIEK